MSRAQFLPRSKPAGYDFGQCVALGLLPGWRNNWAYRIPCRSDRIRHCSDRILHGADGIRYRWGRIAPGNGRRKTALDVRCRESQLSPAWKRDLLSGHLESVCGGLACISTHSQLLSNGEGLASPAVPCESDWTISMHCPDRRPGGILHGDLQSHVWIRP